MVMVAVDRMSGRLAENAMSLSNQELVDRLFSRTQQTAEQSTFKLFNCDTLPNSFLNQGRQRHGQFDNHSLTCQIHHQLSFPLPASMPRSTRWHSPAQACRRAIFPLYQFSLISHRKCGHTHGRFKDD